MKKISLILLSLLLFCNISLAASGSVNLGNGIPGAEPFPSSAAFPVITYDGALAVDTSDHALYVFNLGTLSWEVVSGGGGGGAVNSVGGTAPVVSSGGANPVISMAAASAIADGYLTAANFSIFNAKQNAFAGTTLQYVRGDGTLATLDTSVVPENTNLYYTAARFNTAFSGKSTTDLAEGTNLYYTTARAKADAVADSITDGVTDVAPSQNAVFDALALKAPLASPALTGNPTAPTQTAADNSTKIATTAYADSAVATSSATKWSLAGNAGTGGTGKVGTTDAQDFCLAANNNCVLSVYSGTQGLSAGPTIIPADNTGVNQFDFRTYASPTSSTTNASHTGIYSQLVYDNPNAGFDSIGGSYLASSSNFTNNGSGTLGFASIFSGAASFNNNGITSQFKGITSENSISSGATVSDYYGMVSGLNSTGAILPASKGISQYTNLTDATIGNATGVDSNMGFSGTTANSQGATSFNGYLSFSDTASNTNSAFGTSVGLDANDDSVLNGLYGFNSYFNVRDNSNAGSLYGLNIGLNQEDDADSSGANFININAQYSGTSDGQGVNIFNGYVRTYDTANLTSLTGINLNPELEGSSTVGSYTGLSIGGQIRGSSAVPNVSGAIINPQLSGSAAADNLQGLYVNPQINGTSTLTNGINGATIKPEGSVLVSAATGLSVDMSQINLTSGALAAGGQKTAITVNDGALSSGYNYTVPGAASFFQINYLGGGPTVASGDPTSAFGFGNNLAHTVTLHDDWNLDGSGLGFVDVGFVGALNFDTGTTMAQWTGALGGAGNPGGAGTLTTAKMFSAAGILPQGGSLAVTNMYGFEVNPNLFCIIGTNCWGFFEDTAAAENHLSKLAIGTTTKKVANSDTALEIGNSKSFLNGRGTTATKNALTALAGMQFYDTTLSQLQWYNGAAWVNAGSTSSGDVVGPGSAVDNNVAFFDGVTGKLIKDSGLTLSGSNTGDQTITLTGDVTGTGTGSFATTIANLAVTNAKIANSTIDLTAKVTGILPNANTTATDANTASAIVARDASNNFSAGTITAALSGNASTATALAANPTDCAAGTKATAIAANGDLTCSAVALGADVSGTLPVANGGAGTEAQETPTGTVDNSNDTFTLANTPSSNASVKLYQSGLILEQGTDYTLAGDTITMAVPPNFGQTLYANYSY